MQIQRTEIIAEYDGAAKPLHGGHAGEFPVRPDFSANLNPLGMPSCVRQAVLDSADAWEHYPDPYCSRLRQLLAERIGDETLFSKIVCGNGADDLIYRIVQAIQPKKALLVTPTFSEYENALRQNGSSVSFYDLKPENHFDLTSGILQEITDDLDLMFLCNPNNPTGRLIDPVLLDAIIRRCGDCGVMLVVDECFLPFVPDGADRSALRYLCGERNQGGVSLAEGDQTAVRLSDDDLASHVIVLHAFTKIFSMPGLRLGYCVCGRCDIARRIRESGQHWSVSAPALAAGEALLTAGKTAASAAGEAIAVAGKKTPAAEEEMPVADKTAPSDFLTMDYVNHTTKYISLERAYLETGLQEAGIVCIPSQANFILCRSDLPLYELLLQEGILIRDCTNFRGLGEGWYRIAVRTHAENEELCAAVAGCCRQTRSRRFLQWDSAEGP